MVICNADMYVIGGLDDSIHGKPAFTARNLLVSEHPLDQYSSIYRASLKKNMLTKRGCFSSCLLDSHIYVFGGVNYIDKVMTKSEKYSIRDNEWHPIASLKEPRKNQACCALGTN